MKVCRNCGHLLAIYPLGINKGKLVKPLDHAEKGYNEYDCCKALVDGKYCLCENPEL